MERDEEVMERIGNRLMSHGVYVDSIEREGDAVVLSYESIAAADGVSPREVGRVVNVFREFYGEGWAGTDVEATVTDLDGERQGTWRVDADWVHDLQAGDLSEVEFSRNVRAAIEEEKEVAEEKEEEST